MNLIGFFRFFTVRQADRHDEAVVVEEKIDRAVAQNGVAVERTLNAVQELIDDALRVVNKERRR